MILHAGHSAQVFDGVQPGDARQCDHRMTECRGQHSVKKTFLISVGLNPGKAPLFLAEQGNLFFHLRPSRFLLRQHGNAMHPFPPFALRLIQSVPVLQSV